MRMNMLGMFPFTAPYLAWVLMGFSFMIQSPLVSDLVGSILLSSESIGGCGRRWFAKPKTSLASCVV